MKADPVCQMGPGIFVNASEVEAATRMAFRWPNERIWTVHRVRVAEGVVTFEEPHGATESASKALRWVAMGTVSRREKRRRRG